MISNPLSTPASLLFIVMLFLAPGSLDSFMAFAGYATGWFLLAFIVDKAVGRTRSAVANARAQ